MSETEIDGIHKHIILSKFFNRIIVASILMNTCYNGKLNIFLKIWLKFITVRKPIIYIIIIAIIVSIPEKR